MLGSVYRLTERPAVGNGVQLLKVLPTGGVTQIGDPGYRDRMVYVMNMVSNEQWRQPNIVRL